MSASDSKNNSRYANTNANAERRGWGSERDYRPPGGARHGSSLILSGPKRKTTAPTGARSTVPKPVNLPSQRKDRHGEVSSLGGKGSRHDENTQPEQHTQSLKPQTWQAAPSGSWIAGQESGPVDEYGLPRNDASINTHDFPSLAATASQPGQGRNARPKASSSEAHFSFDDRGAPPTHEEPAPSSLTDQPDRGDDRGFGGRPFRTGGSFHDRSRFPRDRFDRPSAPGGAAAQATGFFPRHAAAFPGPPHDRDGGRRGGGRYDHDRRSGNHDDDRDTYGLGGSSALAGDDYIGPATQLIPAAGAGASSLLGGAAAVAAAPPPPSSDAGSSDDRDEYFRELELIKREKEAELAREAEAAVAEVAPEEVAEETWEAEAAAEEAKAAPGKQDEPHPSSLKPIDVDKFRQRKAEQEAEEIARKERAAAKLRELEEAAQAKELEAEKERARQVEKERAMQAASAALAAAAAPPPAPPPPHAPVKPAWSQPLFRESKPEPVAAAPLQPPSPPIPVEPAPAIEKPAAPPSPPQPQRPPQEQLRKQSPPGGRTSDEGVAASGRGRNGRVPTVSPKPPGVDTATANANAAAAAAKAAVSLQSLLPPSAAAPRPAAPAAPARAPPAAVAPPLRAPAPLVPPEPTSPLTPPASTPAASLPPADSCSDSFRGLSLASQVHASHASLASPQAPALVEDGYEDTTGGEELLPADILGLDDAPLDTSTALRAPSVDTASTHTAAPYSSPVPDSVAFSSAFSPQKHVSPTPLSLPPGSAAAAPPPPHQFSMPAPAYGGHHHPQHHHQHGNLDPGVWAAPSWDAPHQHGNPLAAAHGAMPHHDGAAFFGHPQDAYSNAPPGAAAFAPSYPFGGNAFGAAGFPPHPGAGPGFPTMPLVPTSKPPDWSSAVPPTLGWGAFPGADMFSQGPHDMPQQGPGAHAAPPHGAPHAFHAGANASGSSTNAGFHSEGGAPASPANGAAPLHISRRGGLGRNVEVNLPDNLGLGTSPPLASATFPPRPPHAAPRARPSQLQHQQHAPQSALPPHAAPFSVAKPSMPAPQAPPPPGAAPGGGTGAAVSGGARRGSGSGARTAGRSSRRGGGGGQGRQAAGVNAPFAPAGAGGGRRGGGDDAAAGVAADGSGGRRGGSGRGDRRRGDRRGGAGRGAKQATAAE